MSVQKTRNMKRIRSIIITMALIAATNFAISYASNSRQENTSISKLGVVVQPPPKPRLGVVVQPPPKPRLGVVVQPPPKP